MNVSTDNIIKTVEALAWPSVVLILFFFSRNYIESIIGRFQTLKFRDIEVELKEKIVSLAAGTALLSKREALSVKRGEQPVGSIRGSEIELVERQPIAAVMNKWEELENALRQSLDGKEGVERKSALDAVDYLVADNLMTADEIKLFNRLYEIRNIMVHEVSDDRISIGYALEFLRAANLLIAKLYSINRNMES